MTRHLLTVWNPSYAESIMDAHLGVLLAWAERRERAEAEAEDLYVWWAKIRSPNRQQPLPHIAEILALQEQVERGEETHLYLTDYRSLHVAQLDEVTADDVLAGTPDEIEHMPAYYRGQQADFWFRLLDIRLLVADDTVLTIEELKKLRNVRYHDRPVSLYGGMVELPLVVTRQDGAQWFAEAGELAEGRLWAERDAGMRVETERMARDLRDNLVGRRLWVVLEPATRNFLASAEAVFRTRRDDPRFDFAGPAIGYAKAVETELNALLFPLLRRALRARPPAERQAAVEGRTHDLGAEIPHQSLGALRTLLQHNDTVRGAVRRLAPALDPVWLLDGLPTRLAGLAELRNPAAHHGRASREAVGDAREEVLGIGCRGLLVEIAEAKARTG
jgi:hypothetical protein